MSWFTRSFSMKEEEQVTGGEQEEENEDKEEDNPLNLAAIASATGATVKEDLSNLRKTFTRQLWGVASFLAPPPPGKPSATEGGVDGAPQEPDIHERGNDEEARSSTVTLDSESQSVQGFTPQNLVSIESNFSAGYDISKGALLSEESYPQGTTSQESPSGGKLYRPRLTGLRSDFAELRGTMATGFSRISSVIRVVAGEDDSGEDEDEGNVSGVSGRDSFHPLSSPRGSDQYVNSPRSGLDTFLKPLFGKMLMRDSSSDESTIKGHVYSAEHERSERDMNAIESPTKGETSYRELQSLPSAIASGIGGISKFATSLLQIVGDEEDELEDQNGAVGLTETVVTFATNIATHPETWLNFPLAQDDGDDDFELTNAQERHIRALAVAAPGLEALKIELCPNYMTEQRFWKIYFVLMHSRLSSNAALMLSNVQVVKARAAMLQELQKREPQTGDIEANPDLIDKKIEIDPVEAHQENGKDEGEIAGNLSTPSTYSSATVDPLDMSFEDTRQSTEVSESDPSVSGSRAENELFKSESGQGRFSMNHVEDETEVDEWLDEEQSTKQHEVGGPHSRFDTSNLDDEDVSFSDLEEDDSTDKAAGTKEAILSSSPKNSGSSVPDSAPAMAKEATSPVTQGVGTPRKSSERGEFNDWLEVDQDDVASTGCTSP